MTLRQRVQIQGLRFPAGPEDGNMGNYQTGQNLLNQAGGDLNVDLTGILPAIPDTATVTCGYDLSAAFNPANAGFLVAKMAAGHLIVHSSNAGDNNTIMWEVTW